MEVFFRMKISKEDEQSELEAIAQEELTKQQEDFILLKENE